MDYPFEQPPIASNNDGAKNILIIVLLIIIVLSLLGINVFIIIGNWVQYFINVFNPAVSKGLSDLGYASGTVIDTSADVVSDVSKTGIDVLNGTMHSIGDLLIKSSGNVNINQPKTVPPSPPQPAETTNPIVTTQAASKSNWCLVGEYNGARGCVSVSEQDKCLSGQVFPSQQMCLNPTLTQNK